MKVTATLAALAVAASANTMNSMLPFLMMNGGGGAYYYYDPVTNQNLGRSTRVATSGFGGIPSNMLPFMFGKNGIFGTTATGATGTNNNLGLMLAMQGGRGFSGSSAVPMMLAANGGTIDTNTALAMSMGRGGLSSNAMLPWIMTQNGGTIDANTAMMMSASRGGSYNSMMPFMFNNLAGKTVDQAALNVPMMINAMAGGRSASLSRDVIPALAMSGTPITTEALLPWMMTSGQRYLGGDMGAAMALSGGLGNVNTDALLPYMVADSFSAPVARAPVARGFGAPAPRVAYATRGFGAPLAPRVGYATRRVGL